MDARLRRFKSVGGMQGSDWVDGGEDDGRGACSRDRGGDGGSAGSAGTGVSFGVRFGAEAIGEDVEQPSGPRLGGSKELSGDGDGSGGGGGGGSGSGSGGSSNARSDDRDGGGGGGGGGSGMNVRVGMERRDTQAAVPLAAAPVARIRAGRRAGTVVPNL